MQLLIVDDESHVVDRLSATIDWPSIGIGQVYRAYSAYEALSLLQQFSIDIVITDIQMPGMTGLELIGEIKRRWTRTKYILLSGYSDFEYAKEAIHHQVEDYLLKPVKEQELLATVGRLKDKLVHEWEQVLSVRNLTRTLRENLPLLKGNLLNELLQGRPIEEAVLLDRMQTLGLPDMSRRHCALMLVRMEEPFIDYDFSSASLIEYAICNMAEELFEGAFELWHAKDAHDYLVFVVVCKEETAGEEGSLLFERTASHLQTVVREFLKGHISVLVSGWGSFPSDLPALYNSCISASRKRIGSEQDLFLRVAEDLVKVEVESLHSLYEPPTLIHILEAGRWDELAGKLERIFDELGRKWSDSQEHLLEVYFAISSAYSYIAHKNGQSLSQLIGDDYDKLVAGRPFRSIHQLREWSMRILERLKGDCDREMKDSRTRLIRDIHRLIETNLSQDVSLQTIAEHVHMHPVYISKIYKLETGLNLSDYIGQIRMDKAAYLLSNTQGKIYEIAAMVGYQRPHSFNHAFKKYYGMTPQEYRDSLSTK
ncbi:HTH-type transcriptional activator RhaR [Paenibacillus sp. CECT 9249]|uniref:response regulator n=1 Tax=Paenibacillus sp. CECT 9249 TaxID=2845385 RepID=UPI001E5C4FDE|nr:response regulator [Paenibacillus sp. CECT 9249]CAH0119738.1 HTH-type transcriptional activator RhaR [Paenibacillus sp. CECT 9249]